MSELLTKGCYHLHIGKQYLEAFHVENIGNKNQSRNWLNKIQFVEDDVLAALTPEGREACRREIKQGDTLFFASINEKYMQLNADQRSLLETLADAMLKGEKILFEQTNP